MVLQTSRENPDNVIKHLEQLCNELLNIGKIIEGHEKLGIYYWIDNLTIAYTRVKNFQNAYDWIKLGNDLPKRYKKSSSKTEQERLAKRFEKCRKQ